MNFGKHSSCMQYHLIWCHVVVIQYPVDSYPFRPMAIGPPIPITNVMVKIRGQNVCLTSCLNSLSSNISFLRFDYLEVSHWKYKVKVAKEVKVQGRIGGPTSYQPSSLLFQVSRFYHSWFQNLTVKSQCQGLVQGFTLSMYVIDSHRVRSMRIRPPILEIRHCQNLNSYPGVYQEHGWWRRACQPIWQKARN